MSLSVKTSLQSAIAAWSPYTYTDVKKDWHKFRKMLLALFVAIRKLTTGVEGLGWDTLGNRRLLNQSALFCKFHHKLWETLYSYIKKNISLPAPLLYCVFDHFVLLHKVPNICHLYPYFSIFFLCPCSVVVSSFVVLVVRPLNQTTRDAQRKPKKGWVGSRVKSPSPATLELLDGTRKATCNYSLIFSPLHTLFSTIRLWNSLFPDVVSSKL